MRRGRFCNNCGDSLNPEFKYCPGCGQKVADFSFESVAEKAFDQIEEVYIESFNNRMQHLEQQINVLEEDLEVFLSSKP